MGKSIVRDKIFNYIKANYKRSIAARTETVFSRPVCTEGHVFPVPYHSLRSLGWSERDIDSELPETRDYYQTITVNRAPLRWKHCLWCPVHVTTDGYIYVVRVVPEVDVQQSQRSSKSIATTPFDIRYGEEVYCGLSEAFYTSADHPCQPPHQSKKRRRKSSLGGKKEAKQSKS